MPAGIAPKNSRCIGCGCTDNQACVHSGQPCHWLMVNRTLGIGVCSECGTEQHLADFERRLAITGTPPVSEGAKP